MIMLDTDLVWARDSNEGYIQGKIVELGSTEFEIQPIDSSKKKIICSLDDIFPSCEKPTENDDNCELMFLNEATLLANIKNRYFKDKIYVSISKYIIRTNFSKSNRRKKISTLSILIPKSRF